MDIIALPSPISLPSQLGSSAPTPLQAGQVVDALVLALIDSETVRLSLPGLIVDARSTIALTPGTTVRLAVQNTAAGIELVILGPAGAQPGQPASGQATASSASSAPAAPTSGGQVAGTAIGQATIVDITGARSPPVAPTIDPGAVARPLSVPEALAEATRVSAARQGGLAPLIANVEQVLTSPTVPVPTPVLQAALSLLGLRVPLDQTLAGADIKQAFVQSGLFLEAQFSPAADGAASFPAGAGAAATPASPGRAAAAPANMAAAPAPADLKAALLVFRQVLQVWLDGAGGSANTPAAGGAASPTRAPGLDALLLAGEAAAKSADQPVVAAPSMAPGLPPPPPPYRGAPPTAQPAAPASIPADAPASEVANRLLAQTDAALARHTLMQVASLPGEQHAAGVRHDTQGPQWLFEIPFATRQGTTIAQLEIGRDGHAVAADGRAVWRAGFSVDVEPMGPVHAQITVLGERAAVTLWAEREDSAARLRDNAAQLGDALRQAELEPADIQCRTGAPAAPRPAAGRFLDQAS